MPLRHLLMIFILGLLLVACSTREDFVVLNRSNDVIEVKYKWKGCLDGNADKLWPAKLTIREFEQSSPDWSTLTDQQFRQDECTFVVNVLPGEALRVYRDFNYRGNKFEGSEFQFAIQDLEISGRKGSVRLEGKQTQNSFKENRSGDYVIEYE